MEKGKKYWGLDRGDEVAMIWADEVAVERGGVVVFSTRDCPVYVVAPGQWVSFWAASILDGRVLALEGH